MSMSYGGERRDKKPFEPPPWEREAFERLAKRPPDEPEQPARSEPEVPSSASMPIEKPDAGPVGWAEDGGTEERDLPESFGLLLETLRDEEAVSSELTDHVSAWSGLIVGVIGLMMFVWAVVGLFRGGGKLLALAAAAALMCMGGLFGAAGAWLTVKSLKRQGVL